MAAPVMPTHADPVSNSIGVFWSWVLAYVTASAAAGLIASSFAPAMGRSGGNSDPSAIGAFVIVAALASWAVVLYRKFYYLPGRQPSAAALIALGAWTLICLGRGFAMYQQASGR